MKAFVVLFLMIVMSLLSSPAVAVESCQSNEVFTEHTTPDLQGQGCCSWHGGVCGCSGNRVLCCDGTLSPSCSC
jgi:hypothetical protein